MALGFSYDAPDYLTRARAGMPVDAAAGDQAPPVAAPVSTPPPQGYQPSFMDVLQGVLFNGQSPAEAAMAARGRQYQLQQQSVMMDALRQLPPDQRLAMLTNPGKFGEALASHVQDMVMKGGETRNSGEGGANFTAPLLGFDTPSGRGYTQTPGATTPTGPTLGGGFSVKDGVISSDRTGGVAGTYSLPQIVAPGAVPNTFTPSTSGGASSGASSGAGAAGSLDPVSFFKSFVLPHEGGLNPRDLNGAPTKYGINQAANPGVDVTKITPDDAASIFANKYFANSGAAHLPPAMAAVHADTSFINPNKAAEFLSQSGGDPSKYMDMREAWMKGLVDKYPAAQKYAQPWANRNADLRKVAGQLGGQSAAAPGWSGGATKTPAILDPEDPASQAAYRHVPPGTLLQRAADGTVSTLHEAEFSPSVRTEIRGKFMSSDPYNQHIAAASALSALQHNIGQMTGPAAYTILDTMARTINPGAVARQGTISAIEGMLGVPAHVVGALQNYVGEGKIPLASQQAILNAVTPFAQSHYDEAKRLYDANTAIAKTHSLDPNELTAPIGERPSPMFVTVPPGPQRQAGALYVTPKGPMKWTGRGWLPAN